MDEQVMAPDTLTPVPITGTVGLSDEVLDKGLRTTPQAAAFGAWTTYNLGGTEKAQPIIPFDDKRARALITVTGVANPINQSDFGSVTNPGAFANIAFGGTNLPAGTYQITAVVYLSGTVTSADANNMQITGNGIAGGAVRLAYPGVANAPATVSATISTSGSGLIGVQSIGAASGPSAVYNATLLVTPVAAAPGAGVYVGTQAQCQASPPVGGFLTDGTTVEIRNQQQLWMVPDGIHPVTVTVLMERWGG
jgi:hypothetical protein